MIGYITLGTNDIDRAAAFYDELLATIGANRFLEGDHFIAWAKPQGFPAVSVIKPYDGKPATVGNGVMVSLLLDSPKQVADFHAKALELGGTCEGEPGVRKEGGLNIAYFRDLDGNKLAAFTMPAE